MAQESRTVPATRWSPEQASLGRPIRQRPTAQFAAVAPNPRNAAVGFLDLSFSESVTGLDLADLQLTRNGTPVLLSGNVLSGSGASYTLDLGSLTAAAGDYSLTLVAANSGIRDEAGNDLFGSASVTWTTDTLPPTAQFAAVTPSPRNSAVGTLGLTFSEAVTGVDLSDLQLTRNGQPVSLSGNLLSGNGASYSLNLADHTAASGSYVLTLGADASGIADAAGNRLVRRRERQLDDRCHFADRSVCRGFAQSAGNVRRITGDFV